MGQDRKVLVCSEAGKIWNMRRCFTLKKKRAVSYAVICSVIIYLISFFTEERERQKRERKLVKYCSLSWVVVLGCCELFRPIPALAPEAAALQ